MTSSDWLTPVVLILAAALMVESVRQLRRRWVLVKVEGASMEPALRDGDEVLAKRTRRVAVGDIVVVAAPDPELGWAEAPSAKPASRTSARRAKAPWWVKRIAAGPGDPMPGSTGTVPPGHYFLLGDNPAGADSRRHGPVPARLVLGTMIRKF
ncbi:S26 family signal peptidase [Glycomyces harbinensis]|uniref:Signal peptidase I n=1 Tax=Glycomyces harbinensis TaxID=58114 RepID=A0A1G6U3D1_9ACTN|nr:S26 family signal peptidase [Glycomyces harbinensis]SDD35839.1 signal peptidase I [Glycomyces harbinensis]